MTSNRVIQQEINKHLNNIYNSLEKINNLNNLIKLDEISENINACEFLSKTTIEIDETTDNLPNEG